MEKIKIKCDNCKTVHVVDRTDEIPDNVTYLSCNWCASCEDDTDDYFTEKYHYEEPPINIEPINPNQIKLEL